MSIHESAPVETYRGRSEQGSNVADLEALAASGFKAGVIVPEYPWSFEVYSGKGKQRTADRRDIITTELAE